MFNQIFYVIGLLFLTFGSVQRNYRYMLVLRVLSRVNLLAMAFYIPYGVERLG